MEAFLGNWTEIKDESKDWAPYLKATGMSDEHVNYFLDNAKKNISKHIISQEGDSYVYKSESGEMKHTLKFKLGEHFKINVMPGMDSEGLFKFENGELVDESQITGGNKTKTSRKVVGDKMVLTTTAGTVTMTADLKRDA